MLEQYKKITIKVLVVIPLLISLLIADSWILPQKTINDEIISYSKIYVKNNNKFHRSKIILGYIFFTQKGYNFSTQEIFVRENEITIKHSYILKNITSVKSQTKDYSDKLMSGLNGACLYFMIGLFVTAIISLLFLMFDKNLTENGFQNIILFNSFILIITIYLVIVFN